MPVWVIMVETEVKVTTIIGIVSFICMLSGLLLTNQEHYRWDATILYFTGAAGAMILVVYSGYLFYNEGLK